MGFTTFIFTMSTFYNSLLIGVVLYERKRWHLNEQREQKLLLLEM